jgi:hypothetical protein
MLLLEKNQRGKLLSDVAEYLKEKVAQFKMARHLGEVMWALGSILSAAGLLFKILLLTIASFSLLLLGGYLSVHFEFQRLDYLDALDGILHLDE